VNFFTLHKKNLYALEGLKMRNLALVTGNNVSMTKDERERLTKLEIDAQYLQKEVVGIKKDTAEIKELLQQGKGAIWAFVKVGMAMSAIIGFAVVLYEKLPNWLK